MSYPASIVANAFIYKARQSAASVTHMKVQKLVFFVHAWSLAFRGQSVVNEQPQAWQYGPVFDTLYHMLKGYGSREVGDYILDMDVATGERKPLMPNLHDTEFWKILDLVWQRYGSMSALQLSALTHEAGGPWEQARQSNMGWLDDGLVADFYRKKLQTPNAG